MLNKIIELLKSAEGYISGEELSRELKISRAGIWKYIQELRKEGYVIDASPHVGYKLVESPDKLYPQEIKSDLQAKYLGQNIYYYRSVDSTMNLAYRLALEEEAEGTVVCAEEQSKGKGRQGREWNSPKDKGIYASVILRPKISPSEGAKLTLLTAVAITEAIHKTTDIQAQIKWPNDVMVAGKKVAGILTEMSAEMDAIRFVVVGFGINVNTKRNQIPEHATSLKLEKGKRVSRVELFQEVLVNLEAWYDRVQAQGFACLITRWKELSSTLGQKIRIVDQSGEIAGTAIDLDQHGGLIIEDAHGQQVKRMTGDIVQV